MTEYEAVIYDVGGWAFHILNDNAKLRNTGKEILRFSMQTYKNKKARKNLYYIYEKNKRNPLNTVFYTSVIDVNEFCKENNIKLGGEYFLGVLHDSKLLKN